MFGQAAPKAAIALCDPDGIVCRSISTQTCATAAGQRVTARYACCSALAAADLIWLQERSATQSAYPYSLCSLSLETVMSRLYDASTAAVCWSKLHIAARTVSCAGAARGIGSAINVSSQCALTVTRDSHKPVALREYGCSMLEQAAHNSEDGIVCRCCERDRQRHQCVLAVCAHCHSRQPQAGCVARVRLQYAGASCTLAAGVLCGPVSFVSSA